MSSTLVQPESAGFTDMGIPRFALAVKTMPIGGWAEHKGKWCGFREEAAMAQIVQLQTPSPPSYC